MQQKFSLEIFSKEKGVVSMLCKVAIMSSLGLLLPMKRQKPTHSGSFWAYKVANYTAVVVIWHGSGFGTMLKSIWEPNLVLNALFPYFYTVYAHGSKQ